METNIIEKTMFMRKFNLGELLGIVIGTCTFYGVSLIPVIENVNTYLKLLIVFGSMLFIFVFSNIIEYNRYRRNFKENSKKLFNFFRKWYMQEGELSIFCSDIDWIAKDKSNSLLLELINKGDKASLYLKKIDEKSEVINKLKDNNVKIYKISKNVGFKYRFSILQNDGLEKIIIRDKLNKNSKISFLESNKNRHSHLISLAIEFLALNQKCYDEIN